MSENETRIVNDGFSTVAVGELTEHEDNPREGDLGAIYDSIRLNGFYGTVVAQRSSGRILVGNHRFRAARELGMEAVPVTWVDVDDEQARRILLVDNRTGDLAGYDDPKLSEILRALEESDAGLAGTGYEEEDLERLALDIEASAQGAGGTPDGFDPDSFSQDDRYAEQYGVIVICEGEEHQRRVFEDLKSSGHEVRVVVT